MIFVERKEKPKVLVRNEKKWTDAIKKATSKEQKDKAISKYRNDKIKETLISMFHGKCAYCESYIGNVDYEHIEHFRPKATFPELSVDWDNLLLSCGKCNGPSFKGNKFPTKIEGGPLINPCIEKPEKFLEFLFDEKTQIAIVKPKNERGKTSEEIYGLNKHELIKDRSKFVRMLICIARDYRNNAEAKLLVDEAIKDEGEYAAFARMIKAKYVI